MIPYVDPDGLQLSGVLGRRLVGLSLTPNQAARLGWRAPPWAVNARGALDDSQVRQVWMSATSAQKQEATLELTARGISEIRFPVRVLDNAPVPDVVFVPTALLGILRTGNQRPLIFRRNSFSVARSGYRGFRLYARSIDDVPALVELLRSEGVEVKAREDDIRRIHILDQGLARLFWLIVSLGVSGGVAVLMASLYAAVQRKRRELGIMRLIGFTRPDVFFFPIYQGTVLALFGVGVAFLAYAVLSVVINGTFADELDFEQRICALPTPAFYIVVLAVMAVAFGSSSLAAWEATRIDPAEAIREE